MFVTVYTPNVSTPGRYFTANHPHPHGSLNVTVDGTPVDFTKEKYTHADKYFHFHGDDVQISVEAENGTATETTTESA
ncbi:hypothetical protein [Halorussus caseinilyticus]|uniref:Uncharacterized protein n=1 Tax=Halorussus caseinilyticus TaxID=3034025 RepID=A0ABD5WJ48_9EURY|nr:hypothetical protein [Halorussus sp. DT72]